MKKIIASYLASTIYLILIAAACQFLYNTSLNKSIGITFSFVQWCSIVTIFAIMNTSYHNFNKKSNDS